MIKFLKKVLGIKDTPYIHTGDGFSKHQKFTGYCQNCLSILLVETEAYFEWQGKTFKLCKNCFDRLIDLKK